MISLKTLITITPLEDAMRKKLLSELPTLSEEKQLEISRICWDTLLTQYEYKVQKVREDALYEAALGKKTYSQESVEKMEDAIMQELAEKLQTEGEQGNLGDVREELTKIRGDKKK